MNERERKTTGGACGHQEPQTFQAVSQHSHTRAHAQTQTYKAWHKRKRQGTNPHTHADGQTIHHRAPNRASSPSPSYTHTDTQLPNLVPLAHTRINRPDPHLVSRSSLTPPTKAHPHSSVSRPPAPPLGPWQAYFLCFHPCAPPTPSQGNLLKSHLLQRLPNHTPIPQNPQPCSLVASPPRPPPFLPALGAHRPPPPGKRQLQEERDSVQAQGH